MAVLRSLKDTIALARSERGWTQVEAAGFLGCSQRSFNSWEKGTRKPHSFWMAKLSKFAFSIAAGGSTLLSVTIEGEPPMDAKLVALLERIGKGIECEFRGEHPAAQKDLPLNQHGEGEQKAGGKGRKFGRRLNG